MKLYYFTESFPFGLGEAWKKNEIEQLRNFFSEIIVIPMWNGGNNIPFNLNYSNVRVLDPTLDRFDYGFRLLDLRFLLNGQIIREIIHSKAWISIRKVVKIILFYKRAHKLIKSGSFRFLLEDTDDKTVWYFFWGRGWADILPFFNKFERHKVAIRLHRYDLYKEWNKNYIPFRQTLIKITDQLLLISNDAIQYIKKEYVVPENKIKLSRLGTSYLGMSYFSSDNILRIVSCSNIVPVKRIDRIIDGLKKIKDIQIQWTHIGDGTLKEKLFEDLSELPKNVEVKLIGKLSPIQVSHFFLKNPVDLFINSSESEGVPVSIMEALSFGIPVFATDVGGTSEIVDNSVGRLISNSNFPSEFVEEIQKFYFLSADQKQVFRENAFNRFLAMCDSKKLAEELAANLIS